MIALAVWALPQVVSNGGGVVPTPTVSATATLGVMPTLAMSPTVAATATTASSLPANAFIRQTSNAAWTPYTRDFDGMEMVLVPAGCFQMGNDPEAWNGAATGVPEGANSALTNPSGSGAPK
jgi:formylglycine-generating enzyme required for sulfatase activity